MNDLTRASHDEEIERIKNQMSELDPSDEKYGIMMKHYDLMVKAANEDDKIQLEASVQKLKAEVEEEELKLEEEKLAHETDVQKENQEAQKRSGKITLVVALISSVTSIVVYSMMCTANKQIQQRSIEFEMDGYTHTTRSDKYLMKMPNHKI